MFKRDRKLKKYEIQNLLFFLSFILALGVFGSYVFNSYKDKDKVPEKPFNDKAILNEVVSSAADSCYFYLGTQITGAKHNFHSRHDIPANDDGFIKGLFDIPDVVEVQIDEKLVMLTKSPRGHWEAILPAARDVINAHLHMHK